MLYDIETQIYFPPTMFSPGLENENKTKPDIVKKIDESDDGQTPEQAALQFYKGTVTSTKHPPFFFATLHTNSLLFTTIFPGSPIFRLTDPLPFILCGD
jgi:hypothetical protein